MTVSDDQHYNMHDMPTDDKPLERLLRGGAQALSTAELLAIILRTGTRSENVLQLSQRLLARYDGLAGLARVSADDLTHVRGLGRAKVAQLLAAIELGRRAHTIRAHQRPVIAKAADAVDCVADMRHLAQEQVRVLLLDNAQRLIAVKTVYVGTVNMSVLRVSEVYREAIIRNAPALILAHNHPSGDPTPSPEDIDLTRALVSAGEMLDIQFIDHLIIGQDGWSSLREMGLGF
jgi:DNA repair protein RadC